MWRQARRCWRAQRADTSHHDALTTPRFEVFYTKLKSRHEVIYPLNISLGGVLPQGGGDQERQRVGGQGVSLGHFANAPGKTAGSLILRQRLRTRTKIESKMTGKKPYQVSISLTTPSAIFVSREKRREERSWTLSTKRAGGA